MKFKRKVEMITSTEVVFYIQKNKTKVFKWLLVLYVFIGLIGYCISFPEMTLVEKLYRVITQFTFQSDWDFFKDVRQGVAEKPEGYGWILFSAYLAMFTFIFGSVLLFAEDYFIRLRPKMIRKSQYVLIIGLGKNSKSYIDNELENNNNKNIIIIDQNIAHPDIRAYQEKGIGTNIGDATDPNLLKKENFKNIDHIFISAGSDEKNIEIALELNEFIKNLSVPKIRLIVSLTPKGKRHYFTNKGLLEINTDTINSVEIEVFSFEEEAVEDLFIKHAIDGDDFSVIESDQSFAIMVIGSGELAAEVIYESILISSLPNRNQFKIYCVDDEKHSLQKKISYLYSGLDFIEHVSIEYLSEYIVSSCSDQSKYYDQSIKNIVVCFDDQEQNIEISADLVERVYRQQAYTPTIITALFDMNKIASKIDDNNHLHKHVFVFAQSKNLCTKDIILKDINKQIAIFMHYIYNYKTFDPNVLLTKGQEEEALTKWLGLIASDKDSNLAQAKHIRLKLKALELKISPTKFSDKKELLEYNRNLMDSKLRNKGESLSELFKERRTTTDTLFPDTSGRFIHKLIDCEHERWMSYHFLNGWILGKKDKEIKIHDCLLSFQDFPEQHKITVEYDLYSIIYIPNYLAQVGLALADYNEQ